MVVAFLGTGLFAFLVCAPVRSSIEQPDGIFTVIATDPAELIQDGFLGCFTRLFVPGDGRR